MVSVLVLIRYPPFNCLAKEDNSWNDENFKLSFCIVIGYRDKAKQAAHAIKGVFFYAIYTQCEKPAAARVLGY